jgi:DNA-binding MarR family transcriptional regulator
MSTQELGSKPLRLRNTLKAAIRELRNPDLTLVRLLILLEIALHDEAHPSDLTDSLDLTRAAVSRNVRVLQMLGLVTNYEFSNDRRFRTLSLTKRGISTLHRVLDNI